MAIDPMKQLDVIRKRALSRRKIYDCYRLLYKKQLWIESWCKLAGKKKPPHTIDLFIHHCIEQLKTNSFHLFPNVSLVNKREEKLSDKRIQLIYYILQQLMYAIYPEAVTDLTQILKVKRWKDHNWVCKIKIPPLNINTNILRHSLKKRINDPRMIHLISQSMLYLRKQQIDFSKYVIEHHLYATYWFTLLHIYVNELTEQLHSIEKLTNDHQLQTIYMNGEWLIAIRGSKQHMRLVEEAVKHYLLNHLSYRYDDIRSDIYRNLDNFYFAKYKFKSVDKSREKMMSSNYEILIPNSELRAYAARKKFGDMASFRSTHRASLANLSESEMIQRYNRELKQFANYYRFAKNFHSLRTLVDLAQNSFIKTVALKRRTTAKHVVKRFRLNERTKKKESPSRLVRYRQLKDVYYMKRHPYRLTGEPYTSKGVRTVLRKDRIS